MVTKKDLESIAQNIGARGWTGKKKDDLAIFINNYLFSPPIITLDWMRKEDLQAVAKKHNLRGWSRMSKEELRNFLDQEEVRRRQRLQSRNLMDLEVPEINVPVLVPEKAPFPKKKTKLGEGQNEWLEWVQWLENEPEPPPKKNKILGGAIEVTRNTAMRGFYKEMVLKQDDEKFPDELPRNFFRRVRPQVVAYIRRERLSKVKLMLTCILSKTQENGEYIEVEPTFLSKNKANLEGENPFKIFDEMVEEVMVNMANYQKEGSNLQFEKVIELVVPFARYEPLGGSSFMPLPAQLKNKKAIVNMKNEDEKCFKWCVTRALNQVDKNSERISKELRKAAEKLNWSGIEFPVPLQKIENFERRNPGIAIFVFGFDGKNVFPLRKSKEKGTVIDLLLLTEESEGQQKTHYCWIKNLNRLLDGQVSKTEKRLEFCRNCLNHFPADRLAIHQESCLSFDAVKIEMPPEGSVMKFKNFGKKMEFPYVAYADFESKLVPVSGTFPNPEKSFTEKIQEHKPVSFGLHLVSEHWKPKTFLYRAKSDDEDVGKKFVEVLGKFVTCLHKKTEQKPMVFEDRDREKFISATHCFICEEKFEKAKDKVRDHCHFTGKFRGAAHNECNLLYRVPKFLPVFLHNLKNYDAHFIVKALGSIPGNIKCLANNEEKYISFSKKFQVGEKIVNDKIVPEWFEVRFLDSAGFMSASLASLVGNLVDDNFIETKKAFREKWKLFKQKGVFPYEWLDSVEKFKEGLPGKDSFYSHLTRSGISEKEWEHAQKVWNEMKMQNMGEYHDAYLKADVCGLADVMEEFRKVCRKNYGLDPAWYYTAPGLAWDAALKISKVELELLTDPNKLLFFEHGIRGGVSTIFHRRAQANNKYMEKFDESKPSVFVPYWDANGLYAWAMSHPLPVGGFEWMAGDELKKWKEIPCVMEVDVDIPKELHDKFNDFPPLPEKVKMGGVQKLVPNLWNKRKMVVHGKALKQALELGCRLVKAWRGLKFEERAWLEEFIGINVKLRQEAKNTFEKNFFKLMNNAVFGKTMENLRKRQNIELVCDEKKFLKLVAKPNYSHTTRFDENLVGAHMKRTTILFDKPVYVGQAILDISKTCMYEFHYNYVKRKWPKAQLCFTDTDSLLYRIETEDLFEDISGDVADHFDTSEFPGDHPKVLDGTIKRMNKKVLGMMKDETCGKQILDFVGLRAKCYSFVTEESSQRKCKGIKKDVIKRMKHKDWVTCLNEQNVLMKEMTCFRSKKHEISTVVLNKVALSANDDKRILMANGISTIAHGHWRVRQEQSDLKEKSEPEPVMKLPELVIDEKMEAPKEEWAKKRRENLVKHLRKRNGEMDLDPLGLSVKFKLPLKVVVEDWKENGCKLKSS